MLQLINNLLRQPHPGYEHFKVYIKLCLFISLMVFLILSILQPFNMGDRNILGSPFLTASVYATGSIITSLINYAWIKILPRFFANERWNVGKEMLLLFYQLATISSTIWLINNFRGLSSPTIRGYFNMLLVVTSVGILPYFVVSLGRHVYFLKRRLRKATMMNIGLFLDKEEEKEGGRVVQHENIRIDRFVKSVDIQHFVSAESKEGYIVVTIAKNGDLEEFIVGSSLLEFEVENAHFEQLFRCHDRFIVNKDKIKWVEGNAAGYKLTLHPKMPAISVSNDKIKELKKRMIL